MLAASACGNDPHIVEPAPMPEVVPPIVEVMPPPTLDSSLYPNPAFAAAVDPAARACREQAAASATPPECTPLATDYAVNQNDMWPACISDNGAFNPIDPSISTVARVEAFEEIATLLFAADRDPTADQFTAARMIYQRDEGLDSRVVRRYDPHFCVPDEASCTDASATSAYPDYCVGPAKLQRLILDSLNAGIASTPLADGRSASRLYAARVEAGLLWFLYASHYKESLTCSTTAAKDCDSAVAYYNGGRSLGEGIGLARYVREVDTAADIRAWLGALAVRCWRDLDQALPATNLDLRERARDQFDVAVLRGVVGILTDRLSKLQASSDVNTRAYYWEFLRSLAPALDHEARLRNPSLADQLKATFSRTEPMGVDVAATSATLRTLFACP